MAVNNISYPIYPFSTRTEKGYITKMIPFFFCSVYMHRITNRPFKKFENNLVEKSKAVLKLDRPKGKICDSIVQ